MPQDYGFTKICIPILLERDEREEGEGMREGGRREQRNVGSDSEQIVYLRDGGMRP